MKTILEAKNVGKSFVGVQALKNINIEIKMGEIHCLAGENGCGKSTLVKCFAGVYTPDLGEIIINGKTYRALTPVQAMQEGIQVIYQDLSLFQHLNVAENIAIGRLKTESKKLINWKYVKTIAEEQLKKIGVSLELDQKIEELSMANKQIVAICRALAQNCKILFMDEPTTALTNAEVERLLKIMIELKKNGMAIIFISHKLDEVFSVADNITIFRNGEKIGDFKSSELDKKSLAYYMTGREVEYPRYIRNEADDTPILEIENLTRKNQFKNISFSVRKGDIIGLTGLLGSGRTELALSLFGLNPSDSGIIKINGRECRITSPTVAKENGIALLPEDRFTQGLFMNREIKENTSSAMIEKLVYRFVMDKKREKEIAEQYIQELKVRTPSIETIIGTLSGGNQQKVLFGKWLAANPKLLIVDEPTRGVDVGAKSMIHSILRELADQGMAVWMISSELPEILGISDKIVVMHEGRCKAILENEGLTEEDVMREAFKEEYQNEKEKNII